MFWNSLQMQNPNCMVMVDNCYGEFVETSEPPMVGADLIAGSLIKNPGGTIAPCGGYVAGKKDLVAAAAARLSAPGLGVEFGSTPGHVMRALFQGLFLAPQMVGEAVKGGMLIAEVMSTKGYRVQPLPRVPRHDIVQAVELGNRERLIAFCEIVQQTCPVGSFIKPTAGETPGYASEVIFADGTFIDGSTSELSCDGPLRDPYAVFCQGGTHWTQWALVLSDETNMAHVFAQDTGRVSIRGGMDSSKYRSRGYTMASSNNKRPPPYLLLLLLALGAAALSVGILHKMRERRVFSILLQERDQQLISLQALLQKEQEISKEMRRKMDELEAKTSVLSIERTELKNKLMDSETTTTYLTNTQKELEAALVEKEGHINQMKENAAASGPEQMAAIKELLQQKEAELEEIKTKLHDYKKSDTNISESILVGTNNENTTSDTAVPENSANPGDSAPAEEHHSYDNSASESNQDESTGASTNNENATVDTVVVDKYANSSDSTPATTEEPHPYNTTASESNPQENSSPEQHFIKLRTNREDDEPQDKTTGDANDNSNDALEGSHLGKSELPQWSPKLADSQDNSTEELDSTRQLENSQGEANYESRGSNLLEKEVEASNEVEPMKETSPETELETSKDSLSEANQNSTQAVEPVADPADVKPSMPIYNDETKETSKRRRRRKFRSRRKKRTNAAATNVDGEVTKVR
uniref:Uncharacterized protein n=1 Tax=Oryza nivara TaxID=4536 RepID=A0A0E0GKL5_ORYNI